MKKLQTITLCVSLILMGACTREASIDTKEAARAMLLGKWRLEKTVAEYYQPLDVLKEHVEFPGDPGDSVIFKSNELYEYQTRSTGVDEDISPYEWINDSIIKVDGEHYTIRKLTSNELISYKEDVENNGRDVEINYFTR